MEIRVRSDEEGMNVLAILSRRFPAAPQGYLRQLLRAGKVRQKGASLRPEEHPKADAILHLPESARLRQLADAGDLAILYESREMIAVGKPPGLAVHRGVGHESDNLLLRVETFMRRRNEPFRTSPVHRLDLETSGPVLFAKGRRAAAELGKVFMAGAVEKIYWGLASGRLEREGRLTTPVPAKGKEKPSATRFTVLAATDAFSLLEMRLESGRTHQIRRQLADAGHPLAGDRRYGGPRLPGLDRLFLHCCRLSLVSPFDSRPLTLGCPLPPDLAGALLPLGLPLPEEAALRDPSNNK